MISWLQNAVPVAAVIAILAPGATSLLLGLFTIATGRRLGERMVVAISTLGLLASLLASVMVALGTNETREIDFGAWIHLDDYEVPAVLLVDGPAVGFSLLSAALTALVARFSSTYLHKDPGFLRFYLLLGIFSTGTQLVSLAGALDLMFLGWELIGLSSTLFIGFFQERAEPVRSSLRAFVTYRLCDAGFLMAIVVAHELLGSTRISALQSASHATLTTSQATLLALLFLFAAFGKSAQLPFSGWLPRAMEGPTPSSALFYGGVSIHAGLLLLLRVWPVLDMAPIAEAVGVIVGLATAAYATLVGRTCNDAKGALAHATLAQVGLILAEICLGFTTLALVHLSGHAMLRVWQYLRAPNLIHDSHRTHMAGHASPPTSSPLFAAALFRFRLDDRIDRIVETFVAASSLVSRVFSFDRAPKRSRALEVPITGALVALVSGGLLVGVASGAVAPFASSGHGSGVVDGSIGGSIVFAFGGGLAFLTGLASISQQTLRGLYRSKVGVHAGFLVCAVASGHNGAIVFAALTAALTLLGFAFVVYAIEQRCGAISLVTPGGRAGSFKDLAAAFAVIGAAGVGLPGTIGFVADDLLLHAAWKQGRFEGVALAAGLIVAAVFLAVGTLRAWQRVFLGPSVRSIAPDLQTPERIVVVVVIVVAICFGAVPSLILSAL